MKRGIVAFGFVLTLVCLPALTRAGTNDYGVGGTGSFTVEEQKASAVQAVTSPSLGLADSFAGRISDLSSKMGRGLQFEAPVFSPAISGTFFDDTRLGGFSGEEVGAEVGLDADVYDGLIAGLIYQYSYREATAVRATDERRDNHGISFYLAKRFFDLFNTGLAYNYVTSEHRITGGNTANLDSDTHGVTGFAGISDRKVFWTKTDRWSWATTTSFSYFRDDYEQTSNSDMDTGRFTWGGSLGYDLNKYFTFTGAFNYHNFVIMDSFNGIPGRDDDYWTIGPRLQFYPMDNVTLSLDFESMQGYTDYNSYTLRFGANVVF